MPLQLASQRVHLLESQPRFLRASHPLNPALAHLPFQLGNPPDNRRGNLLVTQPLRRASFRRPNHQVLRLVSRQLFRHVLLPRSRLGFRLMNLPADLLRSRR